MSKQLTVIGGASGLGRHLISRIAGGYSDIHLGDMYPFRKAVYDMQTNLPSVKIHKYPLLNKTNFISSLQDSQDLLFITHDYFKLSHSKNFFLQKVQRAAKGKERVVVVLPIEYDLECNYELVEELVSSVPSALVLKTNLLFGDYNSYLIQHILQYHNMPSMLASTGGQTKFQPIDAESLQQAVKKGLGGQAEGLYNLCGEEVLTHQEIVNTIARSIGVPDISLVSGFHSLCHQLNQNKITRDLFMNGYTQGMYYQLEKDHVKDAQERGAQDLGVANDKMFGDVFEEGKFDASTVESKNWNLVCVD